MDAHTNMEISYLLTDKGNLYMWGSCQNDLCGPGYNESDEIAIPTKMSLDFKVKNFYVGIF